MSPFLSTTGGGSVRGYGRNVRRRVTTQITPEYWWRADSGLSSGVWTAYNNSPGNSGVDMSLIDVTPSSTAGAYFNGTTSFGIGASDLSLNIDAKYIFIRADSVNQSTNRTILGGTQDNIHEWYFTATSNNWYIVEVLGGTGTTYAAQNGGIGTKTTWNDFLNYAYPAYFTDTSNTANALSVYAGTFTNRFRWQSGKSIYFGRRFNAGANFQGYIKEIAIFTSNITAAQAQAFRDSMNSRWP